METIAMTGAETGARAGVGTCTGEGREAETGIGTELGGPGIWSGAEVEGKVWRWD